MSTHHSRHESLVLEILRNGKELTLDEVSTRLPQLQWSDLFRAVDVLSRRGEIMLRRQGFDYELRLGGARSSPAGKPERTAG